MTAILAFILLFAAAYLGWYGSPISMSVLGTGAVLVIQVGRIFRLLRKAIVDVDETD